MLALLKADAFGMPAQYVFAEIRMLCEQAEPDEQVRLTAAHRLLEVKNRLR